MNGLVNFIHTFLTTASDVVIGSQSRRQWSLLLKKTVTLHSVGLLDCVLLRIYCLVKLSFSGLFIVCFFVCSDFWQF